MVPVGLKSHELKANSFLPFASVELLPDPQMIANERTA